MSERRDYLDYIEDILVAIEKIRNFIGEMSYEEFAQDEKTIFAVIRGLEIVGEATKNIPDEVRREYQDVPWRRMAGMRDKLIHDYIGVNVKVVWKTFQEDIQGVEPAIRRILSERR